MIVYKYLRPERFIDVLERQLIRFTQPALFNDPFELRPLMRDVDKDVDPIALFTKIWDANTRAVLKTIPTTIPEAWRDLSFTPHTGSQATEPVLEAMYKRSLKQYLQSWPKESKLASVSLVEEYHKTTNSTYGVLSLSARWNQPLMWAHYTNNHEGFVVGYDSEHDIFTKESLSNSDGPPQTIRKVQYLKHRPRIRVNDLISGATLFHKSPDWKYEEEYRLVRKLSDATMIINNTPQQLFAIHLFDIPADSVREVILGVRMDSVTLNRIVRFLQRTPRYRHVKIYKISLNKRDYSYYRQPLLRPIL